MQGALPPAWSAAANSSGSPVRSVLTQLRLGPMAGAVSPEQAVDEYLREAWSGVTSTSPPVPAWAPSWLDRRIRDRWLGDFMAPPQRLSLQARTPATLSPGLVERQMMAPETMPMLPANKF